MSFKLDNDLPQGWESTTIGEVTLPYETAQPTKEPNTEFQYIDIGSIDNATQTITNPKTFLGKDAPSRARRVVKKGDVLFSTVRTYLKNIARVPTELDGVLTSTGITVLRTTSEIDSNFLFYFVLSDLFIREISSAMDGTLYPAVTDSDVAAAQLSIPPLKEQRRIVAKIEALMARSQRVKEALEAIPPLLDQFRQSVLAAAFRGDLTADWRDKNSDIEPASELLRRTSNQLNQNFNEETENISSDRQFIPNSWVLTPLKLFVKHIQAGKNFSCPEIPVTEDTVGLVKISSVTWGRFDDRETKTVIDQSKIDPSLFIQKGDFLISRANTIELVGASVVVEEITYKIMLSDKVWRVSFLEVENKFINFYLKSKCGRKEIESRATGNQLSMRNISQNAFRDIVIALPPLKEQQEIVRRVQTFFQAADQIKQQHQQARAYLDQLDQSILAKAFRGELVPQDPNDEPASVLLERIRAEREKADKTKKANGKGIGKGSRKAKAEVAASEQLSMPGLE